MNEIDGILSLNDNDPCLQVITSKLTLRTDDMKTERPMKRKMKNPVILCSRHPKKIGRSPGAADSDSFFKEMTWLIDNTVAATNHGIPSTELTAIVIVTIRRSK